MERLRQSRYFVKRVSALHSPSVFFLAGLLEHSPHHPTLRVYRLLSLCPHTGLLAIAEKLSAVLWQIG
jgi:hypothetical protein